MDENLMNILLGTPLRERLQVLDFTEGDISPLLLLRFARECPALRELSPPAQVVQRLTIMRGRSRNSTARSSTPGALSRKF